MPATSLVLLTDDLACTATQLELLLKPTWVKVARRAQARCGSSAHRRGLTAQQMLTVLQRTLTRTLALSACCQHAIIRSAKTGYIVGAKVGARTAGSKTGCYIGYTQLYSKHLGGAGQALAGGRATAAVVRQSALQPRSRSVQRRLTAHMHTYATCTSNKCMQGDFLEGNQYCCHHKRDSFPA